MVFGGQLLALFLGDKCFVLFFCYFYVVIVENVDFAHKIQRSSLFLVELYQKGTVLTSLKFHLATFFDLTVILTS